jgi:hypothetical protein
MPDISYSVTVRVDKGYLGDTFSANNVTATMNIDGMSGVTLSLGTATSSISTATLTSVGLGMFRNLSTSSSNTAQIGVVSSHTFYPFSTLRGGEVAVIRLAGSTDYAARAVSGTRLSVDITEG